jgi:cytochrome P450
MLVPRGLMMLDGDEHSLHRRILVGAFRREAMQGYQELISTTVDEAMGSWPLGKSLPIYNRVKELTLGLAARVILGLDPGPKTEHLNSDFVRLLGGSVAILRWRLPGTTWDRAVRSRDRIRSMLRQVVSNCRTRSEIGRDMVSMLCLARDEDGNGLSDEQVVQHALFMLVAAHDTTTVTVVNAVYELGKHPEWQEKLRSELLDVVDADGVVALESLRATVDEVLRLHPPVPVIPRRSLQPLNLGGFDVPAGTMIFIPAAMVHRDAACWTSGDSFDPTRFSRERAEHKKLPGAWLPFGGGAHACIGKLFGYTEIHLVLGELLRRFRWTLPDGYSPAFQHLPFPIPREGLRVAFHPQHQP